MCVCVCVCRCRVERMSINIASINFRRGGGGEVCVLMNIINRHSWLDYGLVCVLQKPRLFLAEHVVQINIAMAAGISYLFV